MNSRFTMLTFCFAFFSMIKYIKPTGEGVRFIGNLIGSFVKEHLNVKEITREGHSYVNNCLYGNYIFPIIICIFFCIVIFYSLFYLIFGMGIGMFLWGIFTPVFIIAGLIFWLNDDNVQGNKL